jgi:O-antigen ligase
MGFRVIILYVVVVGLCLYAWKDWFKSLCGLILMMAFIEHEDMPSKLLGLQGLNTWNVLFSTILLAWLVRGHHDRYPWDLPPYVRVLLLSYGGVILLGVLRASFDRSHIEDYPLSSLISEELINTCKWVLPALIVFHGCRTRVRVIAVLACLLLVYSLISVQVIRRMPFESAITSDPRMSWIRIKICRAIGYSACDMSAMLAGTSWAIIATLPLLRKKTYQILAVMVAAMVTFGQALTGGRAGYLAWGVTGLVLCLVKWRRYLVLAPIVVLVLPIIFPGAAARMLEGFGQIDEAGQKRIDEDAITSGRALIWPYVIEKIGQSPLVGYGRLAMQRTGLSEQLTIELNEEGFPHPHNMYLETLIDNGIVFSLPILLFWGVMMVYSGRLFVSRNHLYSAVGGTALALLLSQLISGMGSQHFYPVESTLGIWVAMFLALRVHVEERHASVEKTATRHTIDEYALSDRAAYVYR